MHSNLAWAQTFQSEAQVGVVGSQRGAELGAAGEHAIRFRYTSTHQVIDQHTDVTLGPGQGYWRHGERPAACVYPSPQTLKKQGTFELVEGYRHLIGLKTILPGRERIQHSLRKSLGCDQ